MYPTLYHFLLDVFGIEFCLAKVVQSFGLFVAIAFGLCAYVFGKELKRKETLGWLATKTQKFKEAGKPTMNQNIINVVIGFLIGFKFYDLLFDSCRVAENIREHLFSTNGSIIGGLIGAGIAGFLAYRNSKKSEETKIVERTVGAKEYVGTFTMIAAVAGIGGAKIFHLLENPDEIGSMFESVDSFFSGLTIYGGLICGAFAVLWYAKKQGFHPIHVADACMPGLILAYGIGRIGCQVSGDGDWGIDNLSPKPEWLSFLPDWMWAYDYPHNVIHAGAPIPDCVGSHCNALVNPVWPTPFYEATFGILAFLFLWSIRKRLKLPGLMTCIYLIINGTERFFIEKIRINEKVFGLDITQAEIISTLFVLVGIVGIILIRKGKLFGKLEKTITVASD
ncbi:MAG: prolipoprotein diacylglyceryl transferase [Flavobacteriales bacterium]|nr:prolipoprotein diacylglyceryl transferase [Flavobacteriales bacterium]